ncbi:MAG: helix-turn-helix domain-containing protein [Acetobacteraceae bacterium]
MSSTAILPNHLRPRREKVFGPARGISLDRNAKARIMVYAQAWSAKHCRPGQHRGPLTRAYVEVLEAMLWGFHNSRDGRCFPSYEAIAAKAKCCRDTVYEAIKALERADVLTWVNRIMRAPVRELDLFGKWVTRWRVIRTSNAYVFRDPLPCAQGRGSSKSENPTGTLIPDISILKKETPAPAADLSDLSSPLLKALHSLGTAIAARNGFTVT